MSTKDGHVALRDFVERIIDDHGKLNDERFRSIESAVAIASAQMDKRLDGMNEFRDSLKDQANRLITRAEVTVSIEKMTADIRELRESRASLEGKASQKSLNLTLTISVIGIITAVASILLHFAK